MRKISKSKAFELLKNKKIFVGNSTISELVQDRLFKAGYKWCVDGTKIVNTIHNFLYTDSYKITFDDSIDFYNKSEKKEISAPEIIGLDIMDDKLKPFDKVLVRNWDEEEWSPHFFAKYCPKLMQKYKTTDEHFYIQCIPYEGNEDLLGTTDSPKEGEE